MLRHNSGALSLRCPGRRINQQLGMVSSGGHLWVCIDFGADFGFFRPFWMLRLLVLEHRGPRGTGEEHSGCCQAGRQQG